MKKIFILLFLTGIFSASFAQAYHGTKDNYGKDGHYKTTANGNHGHPIRSYQYANQKKIKMERINREYNMMVISIQKNHYMSHRQKKLAFRNAEKQKNHQIAQLNREYNGYAFGNKSYERR